MAKHEHILVSPLQMYVNEEADCEDEHSWLLIQPEFDVQLLHNFARRLGIKISMFSGHDYIPQYLIDRVRRLAALNHGARDCSMEFIDRSKARWRAKLQGRQKFSHSPPPANENPTARQTPLFDR